MTYPHNPSLSPAAYAEMDDAARVQLLFEHLEEVGERLSWIDDEMARFGICAICNVIDGAAFAHDCCERLA
jgi:hypothetical protein